MESRKPMKPRDMRRQRALLGFSQRALAESLGVDRRTVVRWENGAIKIPLTVAMALELLLHRKQK